MNALLDHKLTFGDGHHDARNGAKMTIRNLDLWYDHGANHALKNVNLDIYDREVTAFIGPSGCGKSTLLRCLNRMNEEIPGVVIKGSITMDSVDVFDRSFEACEYRRRFGWVAQVPNPFARSIFDNIAYGARLHGLIRNRAHAREVVEQCLRQANLWDEVKDRLGDSGLSLSGGQQQRLCIARALSTKPEVMLMDEPCSALDPRSTALVEELIDQLRQSIAVVIITHNLQQAARISQRTAFFHLGELVEAGDTEELFLNPQTERCHDFVTGRYG